MRLQHHDSSLLALRRQLMCLIAASVVCLFTSALAVGQDDKPKGPPPEEDITLTTKDNVALRCTWWAPEEPGKEVVPIMMMHGWEGKRQDLDRLAKSLQARNHAVLTVDLRGHGGSTTMRRPNEDEDITIDPDRMRAPDFARMVTYDLEAAKKFLLDKNNEGELNIELLTVVGADMSAVIALNWALRDWAAPFNPHFKQGQDVKALVLLSPPQSFKGLTITEPMKHAVVRGKIAKMILVGQKDSKAFASAKRLNSTLERFHTKVADNASKQEKQEKQDLFFIALPTSLQGTQLTNVGGLNADAIIAEFVRLRLTNFADDLPWTDRTPPF